MNSILCYLTVFFPRTTRSMLSKINEKNLISKMVRINVLSVVYNFIAHATYTQRAQKLNSHMT